MASRINKKFTCDKCKKEFSHAYASAQHFMEFPDHRNHRQELQFVNSQKHTKKRRALTGIKRSGPCGRVRKSNKRRKRIKKDYPCSECNRVFHSATHSFQHFQTFPHHRTEKQQADYARNLGYATPRKKRSNGSVLPTVSKATRTRKKAAASTVMLQFCTGCGVPRGPEHNYCGGCGVQL
jgi:hypothetical protein